MLTKFFPKGLLWLNSNYICRMPPTVFYPCLCTYSEGNNEYAINKQQTENSAEIRENENAKSVLPEQPTTCCMSGCANCVWLEYADKLSEYFKDGGGSAIKEINEKIDDPNIKAYLLQELRMKKL